MSKGHDDQIIFILAGSISGIFIICYGLAFWILNGIRDQHNKLFTKTDDHSERLIVVETILDIKKENKK